MVRCQDVLGGGAGRKFLEVSREAIRSGCVEETGGTPGRSGQRDVHCGAVEGKRPLVRSSGKFVVPVADVVVRAEGRSMEGQNKVL